MRNVAQLVQVPTPSYDTGKGLSVAEARLLIRESAEDRLHALYVLALVLGMRRGELLGLRWDAVDSDRETLIVERALQRVSGELRLVRPKTLASVRTVPLPPAVVKALTEHRERQAQERAAAGTEWKENGLIFTSRIGTPLGPDNLRRSLYPLRKRLGLEIRFHDLRHSAVSLLLDLGVPPHIVRQIVGHSDIGVTMKIYAHASLDEQRKALRRLGEQLS
ncbi:site-specific integrase [Streptomyces cinereospinus]|uniref:Site-specific integrase n=1 Tax=Streptomyces cinereospinus TaxID=285561 RepID=A0ABV5N2S9_9ACTN